MTRKTKTQAGDDESRREGEFRPFANDATARTIGALSIENGTSRIALHGSLDITRDRAGLAQARLLRETLDAIVTALEAGELPETVAEAEDIPPRTVANPFT